ncbi:MAG: hypothetical protein NC417_14215, partial [Candidatus Gastranaerophilales bacterium]|nr:hypothetical protein [Candidatus Gastranaerophilales bacterium]
VVNFVFMLMGGIHPVMWMQNMVDTLAGMPDVLDSFDEGAWYALVDYVTVFSKDDIRFTFKNGTEIKV